MNKIALPREGLVKIDFSKFDRYENYTATVVSLDLTELFRHIEGKMLTIVDASFPDKDQREAVKSLVRVSLWGNTYEEVQKSLFCRQNGDKNKPLI